jgi:hypothetical protein
MSKIKLNPAQQTRANRYFEIVAEIKKLQKEMKEIQDTCTHEVTYTADDLVYCAICEKYLEK